jgi:hypothetical protein
LRDDDDCVNAAKPVPPTHRRHAKGQIKHYFDSIYILSLGIHVRLVCHADINEDGTADLTALSFCKGPESKDQHNLFLDLITL